MKDIKKIQEFFSKPLNEASDWEKITIEDIKNEFGLNDGGRVDDGYSKTNSAIVPDVNTAVEILKYLDEKIYPYGIGGEPEEITKVWNKFPSSTVKLALPMFINSRYRQFISFVFDDGSQYPPVFVYNSDYTESPAIWQRSGNASWRTYGRGEWDKFFDKPLKEAKKETAVDIAKKKLDALGVKYEMSKTDKVRPFKVIYKPVNKSDEFYDKFDDIVDLFNLKGFVKSSMSESKEQSLYKDWDQFEHPSKIKVYLNNGKTLEITPLKLKGGKRVYNAILQAFIDDRFDITNKVIQGMTNDLSEAKEENSYEVVWTDRDYKKHSKVFKNDPKGAPDNAKKKAEAFKKSLEDKDKKSKEGLYRSIDLNEAKEDKVDTITMDIPLFLRMLEYSREDAEQDLDLHDVTEKANALGKEKGILSMEDYDAIVGAAEEIKENNGINYSKLINLIKSADNPKNQPIYYNSDQGVINVGGVGYDKGSLIKVFNSEPGQSLDIKTLFYKANQSPEETKNAIESMDPSIKVEIGYGYGNEPFVKYIKSINEVNLKQSKLSSAEYQKAKKLKDFKASDWKWNADEDLYTKVNEASDYMKRRKAMDDYAVSKKDKPKKSNNPTPSGKTDYIKRREKDLAETILNKLKK